MRRFMFAFGVVMMVALLPFVSLASETYVCTVAVVPYDAGVQYDGGPGLTAADAGVIGSTNYPVWGGVPPLTYSCAWGTAATISMKCDVPVFYRVRGPDVRATPNSGNNAPCATSRDVRVDWTLNNDPYRIELGRDEKAVSVYGAGQYGTCYFYQLSNQPAPIPPRR